MEEQLLQFIWHRKIFNHDHLLTTESETIRILHPGTPNEDQGPDFLQARISIGDHTWAGHVEIHIMSSAWYLHMHEHDTHYHNVILHVVWEEDKPVILPGGHRIACLELKPRVHATLLDRYRHLMNNQEWVPCAPSIVDISTLTRTAWLERMLAERLEQKTAGLRQLLDRNAYDWEQTFYVGLARQMGAPANADAMEELAQRIPLRLLRKHGDREDQMEALLFGEAGMLEKVIYVPYAITLQHEFAFLKNKYGLKPMPPLHWRFMRMRPPHFPTIRIAQLATIISRISHFVTLIEQQTDATSWIQLFCVEPSHMFWKTHYHFSETTTSSNKRLGENTAQSLVINVVAPFMFLYAKHHGLSDLKAFALHLMQEIPPERNAIINGWKSCGWTPEDAGQTQAMIFLKKKYCDQHRCLHCAIGLQMLSKKEE